ncbi:response regulator [Histidinibacterium aquaticum]|uniref:response regulator n=1 Tax=Histidinibacterium aquaticum TaxID=2613962 RepID=UPI00168A7F84|nr:response regulator [Histidinibacterium aquaticum]
MKQKPIRLLIVESDPSLASFWARHLSALGHSVEVCASACDGIAWLSRHPADVLVLDAELEEASGLAVADYAAVARPETRVIVVTSAGVLSDGSIFSLSTNTCAQVSAGARLDDLVALVEHHGNRASASRPLP